ncbi:PH domain-containing protein [Oscillospiraceae bacterium NSJ-54]|uniref:PH domain-containing protein n=2 Tax=Zongyangia hominis TaxID=2763677 RepID=A0A926ICA1_9FIRM|nr:PH domain-containing protein [Zongyangia hominis]
MPITFTKYAMSEDRIFLETGLLSTNQEEVILYRVRDISLRISLGQRIFGVGSILVQSSDKSMPKLMLKNIKHPREVKELIHKQVEDMKVRRRMRVGEILDDDGCDHDLDDDDYLGN